MASTTVIQSHGTLLLDAAGREAFLNVGNKPFMEAKATHGAASTGGVQSVITVQHG
jgi:hypothetical protein